MVNITVNPSFLTVAQVAKILGISRIAVFKRIQKGQLPAEKYGRNYLIDKKDLPDVLSNIITNKRKLEIDRGVAKAVKDYGEALKLLGEE